MTIPLPGPATTMRGPSTVLTASCCLGFNSSSVIVIVLSYGGWYGRAGGGPPARHEAGPLQDNRALQAKEELLGFDPARVTDKRPIRAEDPVARYDDRERDQNQGVP